MDPLHAFSQTYQQARDTFRSVASNFGARLERHAVNIEGWRDGDLAVDVAIFGANEPSWSFVASSGIHGVEGFFGSAVQIKFMEQIISEQLSNLRGDRFNPCYQPVRVRCA